MDNTNKVPKITVVLNNCLKLISNKANVVGRDGYPTLVSYPLARLNGFRPCAQRHKVTLNNMLAILGVQPERKGTWQMVRVDDVLAT